MTADNRHYGKPWEAVKHVSLEATRGDPYYGATPADVTEVTRVSAFVHAYNRDKHSGAGNCVCGRARESTRHPHRYVLRLKRPRRCVCGRHRWDPIHFRRRDKAGNKITAKSHRRRRGAS